MGDRHMVGNDVVTNNGILRLVINLDRSPERMRSISQQLVARDLHFERLPAVDGRKLAQEELSRLEAPYDGSHQSFAAGESYPVRDTELCRILNPTPLCSFAYLMHRESAAYAVRD